MSNPLFRKWVESLPDSNWAKKDLSACKLGWDTAIVELANLLNHRTKIRRGVQEYVSVNDIQSCIHALTIEVKDEL